MYNQDPRIAYAQYLQTLQSLYGYTPVQTAYWSQPAYLQPQFSAINPVAPAVSAQTPGIGVSAIPQTAPAMNNDSSAYWLWRLDELRTQVATLCELVRQQNLGLAPVAGVPTQQWQQWQQRGLNQLGQNQFGTIGFNGLPTSIHGMNHVHTHGMHAHGFGFGEMGVGVNPIRLRENDSYTFCEIYLPQVTIGDVEVEVQGNRITCRTRVPVAPMARLLQSTQLPRGFEIFELPDGRLEFCWISTTPFIAKEVEASFKEGFLCICVPKTEIVARHNVKVVKETAATRRASGEMNS